MYMEKSAREGRVPSLLCEIFVIIVGDGVLDIPSAVRRQFGMRENLPIEVKFSRWVVEDADPYISHVN